MDGHFSFGDNLVVPAQVKKCPHRMRQSAGCNWSACAMRYSDRPCTHAYRDKENHCKTQHKFTDWWTLSSWWTAKKKEKSGFTAEERVQGACKAATAALNTSIGHQNQWGMCFNCVACDSVLRPELNEHGDLVASKGTVLLKIHRHKEQMQLGHSSRKICEDAREMLDDDFDQFRSSLSIGYLCEACAQAMNKDTLVLSKWEREVSSFVAGTKGVEDLQISGQAKDIIIAYLAGLSFDLLLREEAWRRFLLFHGNEESYPAVDLQWATLNSQHWWEPSDFVNKELSALLPPIAPTHLKAWKECLGELVFQENHFVKTQEGPSRQLLVNQDLSVFVSCWAGFSITLQRQPNDKVRVSYHWPTATHSFICDSQRTALYLRAPLWWSKREFERRKSTAQFRNFFHLQTRASDTADKKYVCAYCCTTHGGFEHCALFEAPAPPDWRLGALRFLCLLDQ